MKSTIFDLVTLVIMQGKTCYIVSALKQKLNDITALQNVA